MQRRLAAQKGLPIPMSDKGDITMHTEINQPKEGEVIHVVPTRLQEAVGIVPTVIIRRSDYDKLIKILKVCNPACEIS